MAVRDQLSKSLGQRLTLWMAHSDTNFVPEKGWKSDQAAEDSRRVGDSLLADLRVEVADFAEVRDEWWC